MSFDHQDIRRENAGVPKKAGIRFLPCRDRIVRCRVRFHLLAVGSLHPAALLILRALDEASEALSLEALAEKIGAKGAVGARFTAEIASRLVQSAEIEAVVHEQGTRFRSASNRTWNDGFKFEVVERDLCFLPRSKQLAPRIPEHELATSTDIRWWQPPDEQALYSEESLRSSIPIACRLLAGQDRDGARWSERDPGSEVLERCQLLFRKPQLVKVEITKLLVTTGLVAHRCYYHQLSSERVWAEVYRHPEFIREEGYSNYVRTGALSNARFLRSMQEASAPLNDSGGSKRRW